MIRLEVRSPGPGCYHFGGLAFVGLLIHMGARMATRVALLRVSAGGL
jgi:hypothetical protein